MGCFDGAIGKGSVAQCLICDSATGMCVAKPDGTVYDGERPWMILMQHPNPLRHNQKPDAVARAADAEVK